MTTTSRSVVERGSFKYILSVNIRLMFQKQFEKIYIVKFSCVMHTRHQITIQIKHEIFVLYHQSFNQYLIPTLNGLKKYF